MKNCPICGEELKEGAACSCGWEPGRNYENYPTLAPVKADTLNENALRKRMFQGMLDEAVEGCRGQMKELETLQLLQQEKLKTYEAELQLLTEQIAQLQSGKAVKRSAEGIADGQDTETEAADTEFLTEIEIGDTISFGRYPQDKSGSNKDIKWKILAIEGEKAFLISEKGLDARPYHDKNEATSWEECSLRQWLNDSFYETAFNQDEQNVICLTSVNAAFNPKYGIKSGRNTADHVFLLSLKEVGKYIGKAEQRCCEPTEYAISQMKGSHCSYQPEKLSFRKYWWLRASGCDSAHAAYVDDKGSCNDEGRIAADAGSIVYYGPDINGEMVSVRPVMWINMKSWFSELNQKTDTAQVQESTETAKIKIKKGDYLTFGRYMQGKDENTEKEAIDWIVLALEDGKALLISKYGLEAKAYNTKIMDTTWEKCTLRKWLNEDFCDAAFCEEEKAAICPTLVKAHKNSGWDIDPGNATVDKVFLLSLPEVKKYIHSDKGKIASSTEHAEKNGALQYGIEEEACQWWLRTPGMYRNKAAYVGYNGYVVDAGIDVTDVHNAVRPALWLKL